MWPAEFELAHAWFAAALAQMPAAEDDEGLLPRPQARSQAAVLLAIVWQQGEPSVLLTRRTAHLRSHGGQISLPGGKLEPQDADAASAALREAEEEVGLSPALVQLAGVMPPYITITGYEVTPVLGLLAQPFQPVPAPDEVDEVFFVPLAHLMDVAAYQRHAVQRDGFSGHYYAISYGEYFIWGATAAMLRRLALHLAAWSR